MTCLSSGCGPRSAQDYVCQKIPIEIRRGEPITIEISFLSGSGANDIGIRCSPDVWSALTNGAGSGVTVRLKSSSKKSTEVRAVDPGGGWGLCYLIPNGHYLFEIAGDYHAKASVEITFSNAPPGAPPVEIFVCRSVADGGP
jgi:hypothetical protein